MKKILLSAVALLSATAMNAQKFEVKWLWTAEAPTERTCPAYSAVCDNDAITADDMVYGSGIDQTLTESNSASASCKDVDGNQQYAIGGNFLALTPSATDPAPRTLEDAQAAAQKVTFHLTADEPAVAYLHNIKMDVSGCGTDAVRCQVVVRTEGDENFEYVAITPENCQSLTEEGDGGWMMTIPGWRPSRNDGTKSDYTDNYTDESGATTAYVSKQSTKAFSTLNINFADTPVAALAYDIYVDVYAYGVANNKQMLLRNVIVTGDLTQQATTAIQNVEAVENATVAPKKVVKNGQIMIGDFNIAGQRVK